MLCGAQSSLVNSLTIKAAAVRLALAGVAFQLTRLKFYSSPICIIAASDSGS